MSDPLEDGGVSIQRGTLKVALFSFASAGSWSGTTAFAFRWQDDAFALIGYDQNSVMRNSGQTESVSVNFSTGRVKRSEGSIEDDKDSVHWEPCTAAAAGRCRPSVMAGHSIRWRAATETLLSRAQQRPGRSPAPAAPTATGFRCCATVTPRHLQMAAIGRQLRRPHRRAELRRQALQRIHRILRLLPQPALRADQPHHRGGILGP
jgi:hypothetical protein